LPATADILASDLVPTQGGRPPSKVGVRRADDNNLSGVAKRTRERGITWAHPNVLKHDRTVGVEAILYEEYLRAMLVITRAFTRHQSALDGRDRATGAPRRKTQ